VSGYKPPYTLTTKTAILEGKRVLGTYKEILEVEGAI